MNTSDLILLGSFAAAVLLVIAVLAVVYGRMNRNRQHYGDDAGDPFENGFGQQSAFAEERSDFASIRISREPDEDDLPPAREPGPLTRDVQHAPYEDEPAYDDEPAENVVPLRAPAPQYEAEPYQQQQPFRQHEDDVYQAGSVQLAASGGDEGGRDYDYGRASGHDRDRGDDWSRAPAGDRYHVDHPPYEERRQQRGYEEENTPFVAPYIRDYIEESERRQSNRLDDLRDDMRRQLTNIREEQSNRLDLFLGSIDRKLATVRGGQDREDGQSTRRRIDSLATSVEQVNERLDSLSRSVEQRFADVAPIRGELKILQDHVLGFRKDVEGTSLAVGQMRENFDVLQENFGRMERSFLEKAQNDQSVSMRLSDVVRGTLTDDEYELNARLENGYTADAIIYLRGGRTKVAIDGSFPIETFNRLPSRDAVRRNLPQAKAAEDEFRRTVLKAIFSCAERAIVAGDTADSAILFLPSESAYTILHDRFPDLVRDSHRARVWLTSPSTLMGVLNLLHNVLPGEDEPLPPVSSSKHQDEPPLIDDHEPFYSRAAEPSSYRQAEDRGLSSDASDLEDRLRALREEEEELAEKLVRMRRDREENERGGHQERRERSSEDRFDRFTFDLEGERTSYSLDDMHRSPPSGRDDRFR
jgi:DNA recombination protein RmuC